jgi:hypothetical protein
LIVTSFCKDRWCKQKCVVDRLLFERCSKGNLDDAALARESSRL